MHGSILLATVDGKIYSYHTYFDTARLVADYGVRLEGIDYIAELGAGGFETYVGIIVDNGYAYRVDANDSSISFVT
ncbi:MAG: hypothetical protein AAF903_11665 [Pseudomonadota bacterium]